MADDVVSQPPVKPWRQLAAEVLQESDHEKLLQLARELCKAMDEQVLQGRKKTTPTEDA